MIIPVSKYEEQTLSKSLHEAINQIDLEFHRVINEFEMETLMEAYVCLKEGNDDKAQSDYNVHSRKVKKFFTSIINSIKKAGERLRKRFNKIAQSSDKDIVKKANKALHSLDSAVRKAIGGIESTHDKMEKGYQDFEEAKVLVQEIQRTFITNARKIADIVSSNASQSDTQSRSSSSISANYKGEAPKSQE